MNDRFAAPGKFAVAFLATSTALWAAACGGAGDGGGEPSAGSPGFSGSSARAGASAGFGTGGAVGGSGGTVASAGSLAGGTISTAGSSPTAGAPPSGTAGATAGAGSPSGGVAGAPLVAAGAGAGGGGTAGTAGKTSVSGGTAGMGGGAAGGAPVAGAPGGAGAPTSKGVIGWAAVNAEGTNGTTGGSGGPTVDIRTAADMVTYGEDNTPRVLRVVNNISGQFDLGSNKTLVGATNNITITGGIGVTGKATAQLSNVIVQNLKINGVESEEDAMDIRYAHHVWVDHCEFFDGPDGNLDVVYESSYVTVSWTKFYYTANYRPAAGETETANHRFSNLIGNGNGNIADRGKLRVTFHHNWWAEGVIERMPRVRFGEVHLFNNYFSSTGNNYAIGAGVEAKIVVENNFFENVKDPHVFYSGETTAQIVANGNHYLNTTGAQDKGQGSAFTPPYPYTLEPAPSVKAAVMAGVGPR